MRKCHYYTDPETGERFHIPGCMGGAVNMEYGCTCYPRTEKGERKETESDKVRALEKELAALERIIYKLTKHNAFSNARKTPKPAAGKTVRVLKRKRPPATDSGDVAGGFF